MYKVTLGKQKQKFSAAHFTVFPDGSAERLHGHDYHVEVCLWAPSLDGGIVFPFQKVKRLIKSLCDGWDERVLLPTRASRVQLDRDPVDGFSVTLSLDQGEKVYRFPEEDVILLPVDNVSCENLAMLFSQQLCQDIQRASLPIASLEVKLSESLGQSVTVTQEM